MNRRLFVLTQAIVSIFVAGSLVASAAPAPTTSGNSPKPQNPTQSGGQNLTGGIVTQPSASPMTPLGTNWTYQGRLQPAPSDGPHSFDFTLYDSGGSPLGTSPTSANVSNGYFTADVDFGAEVFNGEARSLGVAVDGSPIGSPQPITAAPYAITALNLAPGEDVVGARPDPMLGLVNSQGPGLVATSSLDSAAGVSGYSTAGGIGVYGETGPEETTANPNQNPNAPDGAPFGAAVLGRSLNTFKPGVFGENNQNFLALGLAVGVKGRSDPGTGVFGTSTNGTGVIGNTANADADPTLRKPGVFGTSSAVNGIGVKGEANGLTARGVYGVTDQGWAVRGEASAGTGVGVFGRTTGGAGAGVEGTTSDATSFGVKGTSSAVNGIGVQGEADGALAKGVQGLTTNGWAVRGDASAAVGVGVFGRSPAGGTGVVGSSGGGLGLLAGVGVVGDGATTGMVGASGVAPASRAGTGIIGQAAGANVGVLGLNGVGPGVVVVGGPMGVFGAAGGVGSGVLGASTTGVLGNSNILAPGVLGAGVVGNGAIGGGTGVVGASGIVPGGVLGAGVVGGGTGTGVVGAGLGVGVGGSSGLGTGVVGLSSAVNLAGVLGESTAGIASAGVRGQSVIGLGVVGIGLGALSGSGVYGESFGPGRAGVFGNGLGVAGPGVVGVSFSGPGVYGQNTNACLNCLAGLFKGNVRIIGALNASVKNFKIDHPLDPANKYLTHASVESNEMMNIYNGKTMLDANGEAWVELPDYFEALNKDFRYQLTAIGAPGPNLYVAEEVKNNRFKIAGGKPGSKVSWEVTGVRHDPYAEANPMQVEQDKPSDERGKYLQPELYGQPADKSIVSPQYGDAPDVQPMDVPQDLKDLPSRLTVPSDYKPVEGAYQPNASDMGKPMPMSYGEQGSNGNGNSQTPLPGGK